MTARKLIQHCGSAEAVFKEKESTLKKIEGIGRVLSQNIKDSDVLNRTEAELEFIAENKIQLFCMGTSEYPERLRHCPDAPLVIYGKGNIEFNKNKVLSVVGTRNASKEGKEFTQKLIAALKMHDVTIVSGLAYGIDIASHQAAYENQLQTIAVLAHGLDTIYPALHKRKALQYQEFGGVISDFPSGTKPDRERFPSRNRIVAGISDATLVIESRRKGGSIITAEMAGSYHRDVFAVPGFPGVEKSEGCNYLIKANKACLLESVNDIEYHLGWDLSNPHNGYQKKMLFDLTENESKIVDELKASGCISMDEIADRLDILISQLSVDLLNLELNGMVKSIPGKRYKLNE